MHLQQAEHEARVAHVAASQCPRGTGRSERPPLAGGRPPFKGDHSRSHESPAPDDDLHRGEITPWPFLKSRPRPSKPPACGSRSESAALEEKRRFARKAPVLSSGGGGSGRGRPVASPGGSDPERRRRTSSPGASSGRFQVGSADQVVLTEGKRYDRDRVRHCPSCMGRRILIAKPGTRWRALAGMNMRPR